MKVCTYRSTAIAILAAALLPVAAAHAQFGNVLGGGGGSGGGLGNLGGLGGGLPGQSLTSNSTGNVAGVLEFCIKNNYLGGGSASAVKNSLMGRIPGAAPTSDRNYTDGASGILHGGNGQQLDLSGGGLKAEVTKRACDQILAQGKSML